MATAGAAFLCVRATTTLAAGASFATPGDGWRSIWQLLVVAVLVAGLLRQRWLPVGLASVAAVYLAATVSELFNAQVLIGAIPVDMRDRIVHPVVGVAALAAWWSLRAASGRVRGDGSDGGPDHHAP